MSNVIARCRVDDEAVNLTYGYQDDKVKFKNGSMKLTLPKSGK